MNWALVVGLGVFAFGVVCLLVGIGLAISRGLSDPSRRPLPLQAAGGGASIIGLAVVLGSSAFETLGWLAVIPSIPLALGGIALIIVSLRIGGSRSGRRGN